MKKLLLIALVLLPALGVRGQDTAGKDITAKATIIVDLLAKVEWPNIDPKNDTTTATIALVGESPLKPKLTELAEQRTAAGHKTQVRQLSVGDTLSNARIVFVATSDLTELAKILKKTGKGPVLTVGDAPDFARYGVMVNFYKEESGDIKLEINKLALKSAGLRVDPQLVKEARVI